MLPGLTLPVSLRRLLDAFAGGFTKPTFVVFTAMVVGMIAQTGSKTVCGMLAGAGLAQTWSHDRVHRFFARAVWSIDAMGMAVLDLVVTHLMDTDAVIVLAVDDTAHRRRGKKVHGASWFPCRSRPARSACPWRAAAGRARAPPPPSTCPARWWPPSPPAYPPGASMWWPTPPTTASRSPACPSRSPGPPGCPATPDSTAGLRPAPASGAGPASKAPSWVNPPRPPPTWSGGR